MKEKIAKNLFLFFLRKDIYTVIIGINKIENSEKVGRTKDLREPISIRL